MSSHRPTLTKSSSLAPLIALGAASLHASACGGAAAAPEPPPELVAPEPEREAVSAVVIELSAPQKAIIAHIEKEAPVDLASGKGSIMPFGQVEWTVSRGAIALEAGERALAAVTPIYVDVQLCRPGSGARCARMASCEAELSARLEVPLEFEGGWPAPEPRMTSSPVRPCMLAGIDATPLLIEQANASAREVKKRIKTRLEEWLVGAREAWKGLQRPIATSAMGCIKFFPTQLGTGPVRVDADGEIRMTIAIDGRLTTCDGGALNPLGSKPLETVPGAATMAVRHRLPAALLGAALADELGQPADAVAIALGDHDGKPAVLVMNDADPEQPAWWLLEARPDSLVIDRLKWDVVGAWPSTTIESVEVATPISPWAGDDAAWRELALPPDPWVGTAEGQSQRTVTLSPDLLFVDDVWAGVVRWRLIPPVPEKASGPVKATDAGPSRPSAAALAAR